MNNKINIFKEIVRFEDVDAASIVHHPVYLKYLERARTQSLLDKNCGIKELIKHKIGIVIASVEMKFIRPLELDDTIYIASQVDQFNKSIVHMTQIIVRDSNNLPKGNLKQELHSIQNLYFFAHLKLALISLETKKLIPAPYWFSQALLS
ncbi:MAG: acyl-CoA thioesterase [Myxococcales bacterium]|nr:acyl-CoA thioesterase [Myxococcales bacterium]USN51190.1 MAG: acyl-CoA thioesterase [Myxococcales bacterium]